jgi:hypothetical protein
MVYAEPPVASPPPKPEIVRTESGYAPAAHRDTPLMLTRAGQAEKALIRYQLFVRTDVQASRVPGAEPSIDFTCAWTVTAYLEREPCFESITGRLACAENYTVRLDDRERGEAKMAGDPETCGLVTPSVADAQGRLQTALAAKAEALFDDDQTRRLMPGLLKSGVTAKPRPLR